MAVKKLLSTILRERTESIEYRAIRKQLMVLAQNRKTEMLILKSKMTDHAINTLQNEGINVTLINEFGHDKYLLKW
jgi:hypothetical protein